MNPRTVRIVAKDIHGHTAQIIDTETGEDLARKYPITAVDVRIDAMSRTRATIHLAYVEVDVVAEDDLA